MATGKLGNAVGRAFGRHDVAPRGVPGDGSYVWLVM
jgi:hypothetical protein